MKILTKIKKVLTASKLMAAFVLLSTSHMAFAAMPPLPISNAKNSQHLTSIDFDGENYMAVWEDRRNDSLPYSNADIYCARITSTGMLLDLKGVRISENTDEDLSPVVKFNGKNYLVVWISNDNKILAKRISKAGKVLDEKPIVISKSDATKQQLSIEFNGKEYLILWTDFTEKQGMYSSANIYSARLSSEGRLIGKTAPLFSSSTEDTSPVIVWNGKKYFSVWVKTVLIKNKRIHRELRGANLDLNGKQIGKDFFIAAVQNDTAPQVTAGSKNYIVIWSDATEKSEHFIFSALVSEDGKKVTKPVIISETKSDQFAPNATFNGKNFVVIWSDFRNDLHNPDLYTSKISSSGKITEAINFLSDTKLPINPIIIYTEESKKYIIGWTDFISDKKNYINSDIHALILEKM